MAASLVWMALVLALLALAGAGWARARAHRPLHVDYGVNADDVRVIVERELAARR